jgi:hypothetical protein
MDLEPPLLASAEALAVEEKLEHVAMARGTAGQWAVRW